MDLVQWLTAQLDEDERVARVCSGDGKWDERDIAIYGPHLGTEVLAHMARHDPARVLREIDAKRQLLDAYAAVAENDVNEVEYAHGYANALGEAVRLLALPYADRPGYLEKWRP